MKKAILCFVLFFLVPVYPSIAGCSVLLPPVDSNFTGTKNIYFGVTEIPNVPGMNEFTVSAFNMPSFIAIVGVNDVNVAQIAAECNIPASQISIGIAADCNTKALSLLGDPNSNFYKRLQIKYTKAPPGSYTFQVRLMALETEEWDVIAVINSTQKRFIILPCK